MGEGSVLTRMVESGSDRSAVWMCDRSARRLGKRGRSI